MKPKLLIGITASERNNFAWDFVSSLISLKEATKADVTISQGCYIDVNRTQLMMTAFKGEYDYILMVDSDMTFPSNGVDTLLKSMEAHGAKIGTGLYFQGSKPYSPVAYDYWDGEYKPIQVWSDVRKIDACGMGFCLIHKDLFKFGLPFTFDKLNGRLLGEDVNFCHRAKQEGFKAILDPSIKLGHLRTLAINEEYIKCVS